TSTEGLFSPSSFLSCFDLCPSCTRCGCDAGAACCGDVALRSRLGTSGRYSLLLRPTRSLRRTDIRKTFGAQFAPLPWFSAVGGPVGARERCKRRIQSLQLPCHVVSFSLQQRDYGRHGFLSAKNLITKDRLIPCGLKVIHSISGTYALQSNIKSSATGRRSRFAIFSKVSNEGAFTPRSTRLRKSTEMPTASANFSWVRRRSIRTRRSFCPNLLRRLATRQGCLQWAVCLSMVTGTTEPDYGWFFGVAVLIRSGD